MTVPTEMRALELPEYRENLADAIAGLRVVRKPVPVLRTGQVLVKMAAAPCNPSDTLLLTGAYGVRKMLPTVPGWEGAGTVVASGGGWMANWLVGKRVACGGQTDGDGTWAEYYACPAMRCVPLRRDLDFDQAACLLVNPLSALGLVEMARRGRHRAAVQTAGNSQLGRMLIRLCRRVGLPLISTVRRDEQIAELRELGAEHILNTQADGFEASLRSAAMRLRATIAFDAVAGSMTGRLLKALPSGSTVVVYGALEHEDCRLIDPIDLLFEGKRLEGFYLGRWVEEMGLLRLFSLVRRAQALVVQGVLSTHIRTRLAFDDVPSQLAEHLQHASQGKVLLAP
jgi:NADPH:quinone reductase-like Zn-dependent oxidoreductase